MSATRLLILGVLRQIQPAHGYSIRQRLEEWHVDEWTNVAFGSIYFALNKMAQEGLIESVHSERAGTRTGRIPYTLTELGEREFHRLLQEEWSQRRPIVDSFMAALAFMPSLPVGEILTHLRERRATALADADTLEINSRSAHPRYVAELSLLWAARLRAEAEWAEAAIAKIERNELP
jgi:DNA-binding PadR family transcriptional regulator